MSFRPCREPGLTWCPTAKWALLTAEYLQQMSWSMPYVDITPMGIVETARCIRAIQAVLNQQGAEVDYDAFIDEQTRFVSPRRPGSRVPSIART
jgi:nitrogenase molybdenum-iron protein alpha/beta subunit